MKVHVSILLPSWPQSLYITFLFPIANYQYFSFVSYYICIYISHMLMCTFSCIFPPTWLEFYCTYFFCKLFPLLHIPNNFSWLSNLIDYLIHALSSSKSKINIWNWSSSKTYWLLFLYLCWLSIEVLIGVTMLTCLIFPIMK